MHSSLQLAVAAAVLAGSALADSCTGGQLVSENQFTTLLDHAPTCFKSGCGSNMTSMSSTCAAESPCYKLWNFLRPSWQEENEWCKDCASDKACWIPGWAVFNATQICNSAPDISLFSNVGACCASGSGPVELSEWLGGMCDEVEWRTRYFASSYGMHPIDWYDHLRALNYTVRPPNRNATVGYCDADQSWSATLRALGEQNLIDFGETFFEIIFFWTLIIWGKKRGLRKVKNWKHAFRDGVTSGLMAVISNLVTVLVWVYVFGYHDDRYSKTDYVTQLFFTLCVRPSIVGYLCFLALLTRPLERRMMRFGHYLAKLVLPVQTRWRSMLVALGLRRNRRPRPSSRDSDERDTFNLNKARQFLANWAFIIAFSELFMQALSFPVVFWTVDAGRKRHFYTGVLRNEYLLAPQARLWYAGGMLHIVFWIPSVFMLLASSYVHLHRSRVQEWLATRGLIRYLFDELNRYYERRRIQEEEEHLTNTWDREDAGRARRQQGFLKTLLLTMTRRAGSDGETAPMLQGQRRDTGGAESTNNAPRMSWARRAFLNLRVGAVTRFLGLARPRPGGHGHGEEDPVRPATPTERTALHSTGASSGTSYHANENPFADPEDAPPNPPRAPEMTTALAGRLYQRVTPSTTDADADADADFATLSPYSETARYYDQPPRQQTADQSRHTDRPDGEGEDSEQDLADPAHHGYYGPPATTSPPARWHRPASLGGSSSIDDANYEHHPDAPPFPGGLDPLPEDAPWAGPSPQPDFAHAYPNQDPAPGARPPYHGPPRPDDFFSRRRRGRRRTAAPPFRLTGAVLARWPFRAVVASLYAWLAEARGRQVAADEQGRRTAARGPDYGEFVELERAAGEMRLRGLPAWRAAALWGTCVTVTVNYVSQWLWWAGFVQVLGDRWCPQDLDFKIEKGIWAAGNFMLVLVSLISALTGSGSLATEL